MTKTELKSILTNHINNLGNLSDELQDIKIKEDLYKNLFVLLVDGDYTEMYENISICFILISSIFESNLAKEINDKLFDIIYKLQQIQTICGEDAFDEKEFQINFRNLVTLRNFLKQNYQKMEYREKEIKKIYSLDKLIFTKRIVSELSYSQLINNFEISNLKYILEDAGASIEDQIRSVEIIKKHNMLITNKFENMPRIEKTQIEMMLDTEFDKFEPVYIASTEDKREYDNIFELYKNFIECVDNYEDIKEIIDKPSLEENPNVEKFEYVMIKLLNYYQSQMMEIKNMIYEEDSYCNEELKREITKEFNILKHKYQKIKFVYNTEKLKLERKEIIDTELPTVNNIFYARTTGGNIYIEDDITEITQENLEKVRILLNKLRTDTLSLNESKPLVENKKFRGYKELRKDQIRIIYTHLGDNNYLIVGVGTKKTDNDLTLYTRMINRNTNYNLDNIEICLEESEKIKVKVNEYIEQNQRKGSR